jgi:hypothetical protein
MNMDQLYEKLKTALGTFGLAWGAKDAVRVRIDGDQLCLEHDGIEIRLTLPRAYADT